MIELTEEEWNVLYDKVDETIQKAIDDLPEPVRTKASEISCVVDKYTPRENWHILGTYMNWTNGPIIIFIGQIFEDCGKNVEGAMASVRQVYYHELAHAIGNLEEYEVKERGL